MSDIPVSAAVIRRTQDLLGKYVKKPALSEKLLRRPPFRFLHDVINVVIQETGYLNGVFSTDELVYENVQKKDEKILYLQKLIDAVKTSSSDGGVSLKVRPSRIVAGHEPEHTNELLQAIGLALNAGGTGTTNTLPKNEGRKESKNSVTSVPVAENKKTSSKRSTSKLPLSKKPAKDSNALVQNQKATKTVAIVAKDDKAAKKKTPLVKTKSKDLPAPKEIDTVDEHIAIADDLKNTVADVPQNAGADVSQKAVADVTQNAVDVAQQENIEVNEPQDPQHIEPRIKSSIKTNINESLADQSVVSEKTKNVANGPNSELIDVIDQEAELRQQERSMQNQKRSTSGRSLPEDSQELPDTRGSFEVVGEPLEFAMKTPEKSIKSSRKLQRSGRRQADVGERLTDGPATAVIPPADLVQIANVPPSAAPPLVQRRTSLRPPSVRPASARPGAPRRRERNVDVFLPLTKTADDQVAVSTANTFSLDLDDGSDILISNDDAILANDTATIGAVADDGASIESGQGHLVQQILQTQKELAKGDEHGSGAAAETDTLHRRQTSAKQMDTLRDSIQLLTRSVHPFGKLMDFLQEDIDAMQMDLQMWSDSYTTSKAELDRGRSENVSALVSLQQQLLQADDTIREHIALSNASRLTILHNEEKLLRLLSEI